MRMSGAFGGARRVRYVVAVHVHFARLTGLDLPVWPLARDVRLDLSHLAVVERGELCRLQIQRHRVRAPAADEEADNLGVLRVDVLLAFEAELSDLLHGQWRGVQPRAAGDLLDGAVRPQREL